jgi:hypothetical protein
MNSAANTASLGNRTGGGAVDNRLAPFLACAALSNERP